MIGGVFALVLLLGVAGWWLSRSGRDVEPSTPEPTVEAPPKPAPIQIAIESDPSGAVVFEGDEERGETPLTLEFSGDPDAAPRSFRLTLDGYEDAALSWSAGQASLAPVALEASPAQAPPTPPPTREPEAAPPTKATAQWALDSSSTAKSVCIETDQGCQGPGVVTAGSWPLVLNGTRVGSTIDFPAGTLVRLKCTPSRCVQR